MADDAGIAGGLLSTGASLATGNVVGAAFGLIGLGTSIFGSVGQSQVAHQTAQVSADVATQEGAVNDQRKQQMELQGRRQQLENIRNTQRARAMGQAASVNQGAQFGTGYAGGQAEATDTGITNAVGINQNLQIGRNIFGLDDKISQDKIKMAQLGGQAATDAGIANIGNSIFKSAGMLGNLSQGFGSSKGPIGSFSDGGNDGKSPTWT